MDTQHHCKFDCICCRVTTVGRELGKPLAGGVMKILDGWQYETPTAVWNKIRMCHAVVSWSEEWFGSNGIFGEKSAEKFQNCAEEKEVMNRFDNR